MVVFDAIQCVLSILAMISIGYVLSRRGWFDERASELFSKMVVKVSLPALMISNLLTTFDRDTLFEAGMGIFIPMACMLLLYGAGLVAVKLIGIPPQKRGVFLAMFAFSNTVFIGLPVNIALFGEESTSFVLLYYVANTVLFWTIGISGIQRDGMNGDAPPISSRFKNFLSPPLMGFLLAVLLILLNAKLPRFVMDACKYMGNLTTPLSMLYIGIVINSITMQDIKFDKDMFTILLGRFLLAPLLILAFMYYLPLPVLMKKVFVIQAAMPTMTQIAIVSQAYKADYKYAAAMVTVTTMASLVFIPLYMFALSNI
ncbi:MAG: malate permease [Clostridiales bacterium]|nr:malate permease [Clostridiales bacterium]